MRKESRAGAAAGRARWYLVYTKPRGEATARVNLERQGYTAYLPLVRQPRRRLGRRVSIISPMFPRYLFVHLDTETDNWAPIRSTLGVVSVVRFGQRPAAVPDDLIENLRRREDEEGVQVLPAERYEAGARVRITSGSLAGYEAVFQATTGRDRVQVLLEVLGRYTRTVVELAAIEPAR
ncbi:transcriptional regulator [Sulfurifustis variabilis]|uniref:Transcriptional regulator n=1 Tax=Sulfurifustis variabilis TaxID=1675686 RepID=A0A1B4VAE7_9GAMM|nr:transcriptional regulator [Sulfurifustis variabilis]